MLFSWCCKLLLYIVAVSRHFSLSSKEPSIVDERTGEKQKYFTFACSLLFGHCTFGFYLLIGHGGLGLFILSQILQEMPPAKLVRGKWWLETYFCDAWTVPSQSRNSQEIF